MIFSQPLSEVRERLETIFPDFAKWLEENSTYATEMIQDRSNFSECGLFLDLVHFLQAFPDQWKAVALQGSADLLGELVLSSLAEFAAELCFLETAGMFWFEKTAACLIANDSGHSHYVSH